MGWKTCTVAANLAQRSPPSILVLALPLTADVAFLHLWALVSSAVERRAGHVTGFQTSPPNSRGPSAAPHRRSREGGYLRDEAPCLQTPQLYHYLLLIRSHSKIQWLKQSPLDLLTILWVITLDCALLSSSSAGVSWGPSCCSHQAV